MTILLKLLFVSILKYLIMVIPKWRNLCIASDLFYGKILIKNLNVMKKIWRLCRGRRLPVGFLFSLLPTLSMAASQIQMEFYFTSLESGNIFVANIFADLMQ